ncbi:uncharacterized protein [Parasteatoda tepidariorum]|uniref:uncharacterized protein n=1 Tax=Parasteatoda tepidariorum TaxID=114398 RepID=UPI0039BCF1DD
MSKKVAYVEDKLDYESDIYSIYRKDTPEEIMSKIMHFLKEKHEGSLDIAVDVGCGSGQSTIVLAPTFKTVFGIDGIESQIEEANNNRKSNNIVYKCGPAETLPFENNSVQLITTATSLHWFDMTLFFSEAKRILCNNGVLAVYGYSRIKPSMSTPALDQKVNQLYDWVNDSSVIFNCFLLLKETEIQKMEKLEDIFFLCSVLFKLKIKILFENNSVQLITTATSLHWFDMTLFFSEAKRILCNNGVLAVYGYSRIKPSMSTPALDQKVNQLYDWFYDVLDPYTKPQVKILIHKYNKVEFPFEEVVRVPDVRCMIKGSLSDIVGYVKTYSMLNICREQDPGREVDILSEFEKRLYKIGEEDNITPNEVTNLYIDYVLILCRKVVAQTVQ